jgi:hypothetical protein
MEQGMRLPAPYEALHDAIAAACWRDLPDFTYEDRDWSAWQQLSKPAQMQAIKDHTVPMVSRTRRPRTDDIEVLLFAQTWGSTALGYGGIGGAAMTSAYTVVVIMDHRYHCVYFGGDQLAYRVDIVSCSREGKEKFMDDLRHHVLADVRGSARYL